MIVINLFAGTGCGKSTLASYIFHFLKKDGYNAELVTEYAKELTCGKKTLINYLINYMLHQNKIEN